MIFLCIFPVFSEENCGVLPEFHPSPAAKRRWISDLNGKPLVVVLLYNLLLPGDQPA